MFKVRKEVGKSLNDLGTYCEEKYNISVNTGNLSSLLNKKRNGNIQLALLYYICEYLNDGLTNTGANSVIGHKKNYKGYCLYVRKCIELKPFIQKMAHLREFNKTTKVLKVPFEKRRKDIQMSRICYFQLSTFGVLVAYLIRKVRYRK